MTDIPEKRGRSLPRHVPTETTRAVVEGMMAVGATADEAAREIGIGHTILYRRYAEEIKAGSQRVLNRIAMGVVRRALNGDNACSFFVLKTRGGWREVNRQEHTGADGGPIQTEAISPMEAARVVAFALAAGAQQPPTDSTH